MKEKIGNLTKIRTGKLDANASSTDGIYPFFTCSRETLKISTYSYDCECVLIAGNGDLNVKYYNGKFDAYQRTYIVEGNGDKRLYIPYLYYFMDSYLEELRKQSIGGVIKYIKLGNLTNAFIELPSIELQKHFARILNEVEALIALQEKTLSKLDELVKSRFVEMFEKGEFERIPFEAFCEFLRNGASIKQTKGAGGYPITRIETLANDAFNLDRLGYANITELKGFEKYILQKGDILISHINSVAYLGRAVQYRGESNTPIIHGMNLLCARLRHDCNSTYIEYFFKTPMAKDYISTITKKAVNQASITTTDLKKMLIPAPPLELQNRFAAFVAEVDKSKLAVKQSLEKLETLKKSLMQQYFG